MTILSISLNLKIKSVAGVVMQVCKVIMQRKNHTGLCCYKLQNTGEFFSKGTKHHRIYTSVHFSPSLSCFTENDSFMTAVLSQKTETFLITRKVVWIILYI